MQTIYDVYIRGRKGSDTDLLSDLRHLVRIYNFDGFLRDKLNGSFTDEDEITLRLDLMASYMFDAIDFQENRPLGDLSSMAESDLFAFRYSSDMCYPKYKNEQEMQLYYRSTGRLHSYFTIQTAYISKRSFIEGCPLNFEF